MFLRVQGASTGVLKQLLAIYYFGKRGFKGSGFFLPESVLHHDCRVSAQRPLAELLNVHPHQNSTLSAEDLEKYL